MLIWSLYFPGCFQVKSCSGEIFSSAFSAMIFLSVNFTFGCGVWVILQRKVWVSKWRFVISTKIQTINKLHFNFTRKHLCWSLFLIKLQALKGCNFIKNSPTQMFSYEYCEIFNNTYFEEHLRTAASVHLKLGFLKIGLLKSSLEFSC